jgi:hypothetical protein
MPAYMSEKPSKRWGPVYETQPRNVALATARMVGLPRLPNGSLDSGLNPAVPKDKPLSSYAPDAVTLKAMQRTGMYVFKPEKTSAPAARTTSAPAAAASETAAGPAGPKWLMPWQTCDPKAARIRARNLVSVRAPNGGFYTLAR